MLLLRLILSQSVMMIELTWEQVLDDFYWFDDKIMHFHENSEINHTYFAFFAHIFGFLVIPTRLLSFLTPS